MLNMTTKTMQDLIIRRFGFEHPNTIYFFEECERNGQDDDFMNGVVFCFIYDEPLPMDEDWDK